ncbi:MAG TPA: DNA helicase, partial [Phaeodactylibacter sp.]|nr:DNA helicase [Phaeodactylibacter sp.]
DHRQLPAVVKQDSHSSKVKDENLQAIGLNNLRNSLFERLYNRCQKENWDWAYGQLTHQGRMHQDIMAFSSRLFYGNALKTLPEGSPKHEEQNKAIEWELPDDAGPIEKMLCSQRVLFLNTPPNDTEDLQKNNPYEAKRIAELILAFQKIYAFNGVSFTKDTLGIITPYRAQIAQIKSVLQEESISDDLLTIDTVERYQGGARDIILLSLCANHSRQLRSLISHSDEGVDRKLNVALTRARKHLIILGNAEVLKADRVYRELMDYARIRKEI